MLAELCECHGHIHAQLLFTKFIYIFENRQRPEDSVQVLNSKKRVIKTDLMSKSSISDTCINIHLRAAGY